MPRKQMWLGAFAAGLLVACGGAGTGAAAHNQTTGSRLEAGKSDRGPACFEVNQQFPQCQPDIGLMTQAKEACAKAQSSLTDFGTLNTNCAPDEANGVKYTCCEVSISPPSGCEALDQKQCAQDPKCVVTSDQNGAFIVCKTAAAQ
jgi:hypothetical protein